MKIACASIAGLCLLGMAGMGLAGGSSPLLTLGSADAYASAGGARGVEARGSFNFEDVLEGTFPAGLVVYQGTHFVRFDQAGAVVEGTSPLLSDGLDATEVPTIVGGGGSAGAPAGLVQLRADRVTVVLPSTFSAGTASVALYAVYENTGYASNALTVSLP